MNELEAINTGLERDEFFLEYLPTVALDTECCVGGEALIRWRRDGQVVPPLAFIPQVEGTPLAERITHWVIDRVARELGPWLRAHELVHIGINVPPQVFVHHGIEQAVIRSDLKDVAHKLVFEVSARTAADTMNVSALGNKKDSQVLIALDDVGSSKSDVVVVARARVDIVKIDKSFVDKLLQPACAEQQLEQLATLMNGSSLAAIAEGVELAQQVALLREAGVQMAQGWYFSRPLSADAFKDYFDAHQPAPAMQNKNNRRAHEA